MKRFLYVFICIMLIASISSCGKKKLPYEYDNNREVSTFDVLEVEDIPDMNMIDGSLSIARTMDKMKDEGIAQVLRYNKDQFYSMTPLSDGRYLIVLFHWSDNPDNVSTFVQDYYIAAKLTDRASFEEAVKVGLKLEDVIASDPNTVVEEYVDYFDGPQCSSFHRFSDKSYIGIKYVIDEKTQVKTVSEIVELDATDSVITYLLPKDFALLTGE